MARLVVAVRSSKKLRYNVYGRSCKLVVLRLFHSGFEELHGLGVFFLMGFSLREQSIISCVCEIVRVIV